MTDLTPGPRPSPSQAKCSVCAQTFSGVYLFDRHRKDGTCLDPRQMKGLRQDPRGVWRSDKPNRRFPLRHSAVDGPERENLSTDDSVGSQALADRFGVRTHAPHCACLDLRDRGKGIWTDRRCLPRDHPHHTRPQEDQP